ncbi:MAG: hypothetical protein IID37_11020 [Planctomycetes bacterium]|nr:hypothetical protein [Planctomycetota bacterium]
MLVLDGFTITAGNANGSGGNNVGGGIVGASFTIATTISNCIIRGNRASASGLGGGGFFNLSGSPELINCTFSGNQADGNGGGFYLFGGGPLFTNCTFSENTAGGSGGGIYSNASVSLANSILWGNSDSGGMDESAQFHKAGGSASIDYSCIQGWTGMLGGIANIGNDPQFVDADGPDGIPGTFDDNLRLSAGSACVDTGDNVVVTVATDLDDNPRILYGGMGDIVDMGAYEFFADCNTNGVPDSCDINCSSIGCEVYPATCSGSADVNTDGIPDECQPSAAAWQSCAVHDPNGVEGPPTTWCMDIVEVQDPPDPCDPRADTQIECRFHGTGGTAQAFLQIVIDLNQPAAGAVAVNAVCTDASTHGATVTVSTDGMTVTADFDPPLPNTECCTITLGGGALGSQLIKILQGDVDGSGRVNATDKNLVKGKITSRSPPLAGDDFFYDVNMSGRINATDKNLVKGKITTANELNPLCPDCSP